MNITTTYEQPLNESMRICLRVESLFERIDPHVNADSTWQSALALAGLIELLGVLSRPDLKTRLVKTMADMSETLNQLAKHPDIYRELDRNKLDDILQCLRKLLEDLDSDRQRIGQSLYENAFLKSVRCDLTTPGGTCHFNAPVYHLWLQQPSTLRQKDLRMWLGVLSKLRAIVELLLKLARESAQMESAVAKQGFYQCTLNPNKVGYMMRVTITSDIALYPVFSVGRHRCALHFYQPHFHGVVQPRKYQQDVSFRLAYCAL